MRAAPVTQLNQTLAHLTKPNVTADVSYKLCVSHFALENNNKINFNSVRGAKD